MSYPDDNPKTAIGATKAPLHLVPPSAIHYLALAFKDGAAKYGPYNWRDQKISSSVYVGAALRHIGAWWDGANVSSDAGVEHLAHIMACCAIILDAASVGMLNDDRPTNGAAPRLQAEFAARKVQSVECGGCAPPVYASPRQLYDETSAIAVAQDGVPAESADLAREVLTAEELRGFGIGDVEPRAVAETATTVATSQHPMAAETLRDEYEKTDGETGV